MKIHNCDLCGASDRLPLPGDPSGKIGICTGCGFVYVAERRDIKDVAQAWDQIYANGGYDPNWPGVKARLYYVAEWISQHIGLAGNSVLDIGAGNGLFLDFCRGHGAHVVGIDPSPNNVAKVKTKDIACFHGWAGDDQPDIGQYDIVTLNWTLENTGDCMSVLRWAKRQLAPNGYLVVATGSRIGVPFKKPLSSYLPQDPDYPHDTHCFRWSMHSLACAAARVQMSTVDINDHHNRDELVMVFYHHDEADAEYCYMNPSKIVSYFERWQREFPCL